MSVFTKYLNESNGGVLNKISSYGLQDVMVRLLLATMKGRVSMSR